MSRAKPKEEIKFNMRVMLNRDKTKVLFAKVDDNLADVLLSFFTLPLGTIVKLLQKHYGDQTPAIGSLNTLHKSLVNLDTAYFCTEMRKHILLNPSNSFYAKCKNLKLNIDDTCCAKYFTCENPVCKLEQVSFYSAFERCGCGRLMNVESRNNNKTATGDGEVFMKKPMSFLLADNMCMIPNVESSVIRTANNLLIKDIAEAEQKVVAIGLTEIVELLMGSLVSQTPLTDLILNTRHVHKKMKKSEPSATPPSSIKKSTDSMAKMKMVLKATVQKSTNKFLFAQVQEDFVDFLFRLLTIPLGQVECLLGNKTCLPSIDNLYRSTLDMNSDKFKSEDIKALLLNSRLPPKQISPEICVPPSHGSNAPMTPLLLLSSFCTLNEWKIPLCDVEELELQIGLEESLSILKASLTSTNALSNGLNHLLVKQPKPNES